MKTLWVIDPSLNCPETEGVEQVLAGWPGSSRLLQPALKPGDGPQPDDGYEADGIVLLGSAASVHENHAWQSRLTDWLRPLLDGTVRRPLLGICYGHQLIAHAAGGVVEFLNSEHTKRVGVETSCFAGSGLLDSSSGLRVVVSHREHVVKPPNGWVVTARRPGVPVDGLEHPEYPVFSYQFHPEAREEFCLRGGIPADAVDEALRQDGQQLLGAFRRRVMG